MSLSQPTCPICRSALARTTAAELDTWNCPAGHGLAITTSEAAHRIQDDEMALLMGGWPTGAPTDRPCPTCEVPMRRVHISVDDDEVMDPQAPGHVELCQLDAEVCRTCLFLWLDSGELEQLPMDLANAEFVTTAEQQGVLDQIRIGTAAAIEQRYQELDRHDLAERILRRLHRRRKAA